MENKQREIKRKKRTPYAIAEDKAKKIFKRYIRIRDCRGTVGGCCYTCGKYHDFVDLDAGHFQQGSHLATYFEEDNVHAQCTYCNRYNHGNLINYTLRMIKEYGQERVDDLIRQNHTVRKFKTWEFDEITEKYKQKIADLTS